MHKYLFIGALTIALFATTGQAQSDDFHKFEGYIGYSNNQAEVNSGDANNVGIANFFDGRANYNGFEVSGTANFSRYVGAKIDFSAHFKEFDNSTNRFGTRAGAPNFNVKSELYNSMVGVQVKDNSKEGSRVKPFGQLLVGVVYGKNRTQEFNRTAFPNSTFPQFFNKGDYGAGGLDVRLGERVDFRAIQIDYNPTRLFGETQHNVRFGAGFVFH